MDLSSYENLGITSESGVQVITVRERASRAVYQVHVFRDETLGEFDRLSSELPDIPTGISRLVEITRDRTAGYIRTEPLPDGVGIVAWAASLRANPAETEAARIYHLALQLRARRQNTPPR